jgi:hypothetical protein
LARRKIHEKILFYIQLGFCVHIQTVQAQSKKYKPTLSIKLGTYLATQDTDLRVDSETLGKGIEFNFEDTLKLDNSLPLFRIEGDFRISRRFEVGLGYYRIKRSNNLVTLNRTIQFEDKVFEIGAKVDGFYKFDLIKFNLRYSIFLNETFDLGLYLGINTLFYEIGLESDFQEGREAVQKDVWAPVPSLGVHATWNIVPKLDLKTKVDYFFYTISEALDFNQLQFNAALEYFPIRYVGIGLAYDIRTFTLDLDKSEFGGRIKSNTRGLQLYVIVGF